MFSVLHCHSHYSLLDGISKPDQIAQRISDLGYSSCALTDHGSISGCPEFHKSMTEKGLKPILGVESYLCKGDASDRSPANGRPYSHLCVLSRDLSGWKSLVQAVSRSASKEYSYYHPRLNLEDFRDFANGNLIAFSGHCNSDLANCLFYSPKEAYSCLSYDVIKAKHIKPDCKNELKRLVEQYISIFGKGNFYLEKNNLMGFEAMPAMKAVNIALDYISDTMGVPKIACPDSHFLTREDAYLQRTVLCSKLRTTHNQVQKRILNEEDVELGGFFKSDCLHIPTIEDMLENHTREEIEMAYKLGEEIESYSINSEPKFPVFDCPNRMSDQQYLRALCEQGFNDLIRGNVEGQEQVYIDRMERELNVINKAGIASYFLILSDIIRFARSKNWHVGCGRGSASGCLSAYLSRIVDVDAVKYGLLFERFINEARLIPGKPALPDIDIDLSTTAKKPVFNYLKEKYGEDKVARISTFNTMMGKSVLQEVLAAHEVPHQERTQITAPIVDKSKISEELQAMGENASVLRYMLEEQPKELEKWVRLKDDGTLVGQYANYMKIALRLEGTIKNVSTHAAGIVVASEPISNFCPVIRNKDDELQTAVSMSSVEQLGGVKLDVLTIALLDKGMTVRNLCLTGECDA